MTEADDVVDELFANAPRRAGRHKMRWTDKGRFRLYAGVLNLLISAATLGILVFKVIL